MILALVTTEVDRTSRVGKGLKSRSRGMAVSPAALTCLRQHEIQRSVAKYAEALGENAGKRISTEIHSGGSEEIGSHIKEMSLIGCILIEGDLEFSVERARLTLSLRDALYDEALLREFRLRVQGTILIYCHRQCLRVDAVPDKTVGGPEAVERVGPLPDYIRSIDTL